jgi:hypothetical protein
MPGGELVTRRTVSAKAEICLDRLAVLFGSLRAAYELGYRYIRTPYPPDSPNYPHCHNRFTLPDTASQLSPGPFVRHLKELEARARGEPPRGPAFAWFDATLAAEARSRMARLHDVDDDAALHAALRASAAEHGAADAEQQQLEAALRASLNER